MAAVRLETGAARSWARALRLLFATLFLGVVAAAGAGASHGGGTGEIAYSEAGPPCPNGLCRERIVVANVDGSGRHLLTTTTVDLRPEWSPDGRLIAFARITSRGCCELWVMHADGSGPRRLTTLLGVGPGSGDFGWSRNGKGLIFAGPNAFPDYPVRPHPQATAIDEVNIAGTPKVKKLFVLLGVWLDPQWSPAADELAVVRAQTDGSSIWTVGSKGRGLRKVASDLNATAPSWSPSGRQIAYAADADTNGSLTIYVVDADGSSPHPLWTDSPTGGEYVDEDESYSSWSPDGRTLVFTGHEHAENAFSIRRVPVDGGAVTPVSLPQRSGCTSAPGSPAEPCNVQAPSWRRR